MIGIYKKSRNSIYIAAYATMAISFFWGLYFLAPAPIKIIFSLGMWTSVFLFPFILIKHNDISKWGNILLNILMLMAAMQIFRSAINTDDAIYAFGNKWITLFGNEYTSLLLITPLFTYLGSLKYNVVLLKRATWIFLVLGALCSFTLKNPLSWITIFGGIYFPYVDKRYKGLLLLAIFEAFLCCYATRMYIIILSFTFASYILVYILNKPKWTKVLVISTIIIPLFLFVPLLLSKKEMGSFEKMKLYVLNETQDESLASDTRTFLYLEIAEDLTQTNSWLIGKGAFSHYYSLYFDQSSKGKYGRLTSEVPFLNYLLRGGILYVVFYFGLILLAVYKAIWQGKNKFVQSIGIIAVGWYFNTFVGDITGNRFYHIAFFLLLGCCLSKKWLNYTDLEIKRIMKK